MADLTRLVDSADCSTPGCPNEADRADGLCRMCRTVPSRRTLLAPTPGSLAHLVDQEDTPMPTATCKIDGCDNPSAGKGGWCVGLCQTHISEEGSRGQRLRHERARASSAKTPASVKAPTSPAPRPDTAPAGTTTPADTRAADDGPSIVQVAQDFEDALHRYQRAKGDLETALERLNAAVEELAA